VTPAPAPEPGTQSQSREAPPRISSIEQVLLLAAIALGMFWALQATNYASVQWYTVALLLAGFISCWFVVRSASFAPWITLVYAAAVGIADRLPRVPFSESDVLKATTEALGVLAQGQNPYAHFFTSTNPPGSLLPYPPGEILFYAIPRALFGQVFEVDKWTGIGVVLTLAALAACVGPARAAIATALYATFGQAAALSVDGSNDTSLAFLLVLAIVLLAFSERRLPGDRIYFYASAIAFAWALAFKEFAWLLYPFILTHLYRRGDTWLRYAAVSFIPAAILTLYFFALSPGDFLHNVAGEITVHKDIFGVNLWSGLHAIAPQAVDAVRPVLPIIGLIAGAAIAIPLLLRPARLLSTAIFQGLAVIFVALFFPRWTAAPYYAGAAAVLTAAIALTGIDLSDESAWSGMEKPEEEGNVSLAAPANATNETAATPAPSWPNAPRPQKWHTPAFCGAIAIVVALLAVVPTLCAAGGRVSVLVHVSEREPMANVARAIDPKFAFVPAQAHSDGVHFYAIAMDPFGFGAAHSLIDDGIYRYGHPGYGWLIGLISFGQAQLFPAMMLLANLALLAAAAIIVSLIAVDIGRSAWWGLLVSLNPGFIYALTDDTTEPAVMAVSSLGLLLWLRGRRLGYAFLAAGCFIKEVGLLVPAGIALYELAEVWRDVRPVALLRSHSGGEVAPRLRESLESGRMRRLLALAIGPGLFILWWVFVRLQFGAWPVSTQGLLTFPLTGVADTLTRGANWLFGSADQVQIGAASVAFVAITAAAFVLMLIFSIRLRTPFQGIALLMVLLVLSESWLELLYPKDLIRDAAVPFIYLALALLAGDRSTVSQPAVAAAQQPAPSAQSP
jgi:hypothetical protein